MAATVSDDTALFFRDQLREARAKALASAENFDDLIHIFERLGSYLTEGEGHSLYDYEEKLVAYADGALQLDPEAAGDLQETLTLVRESRNDATHQGAFARHLTRNAVKLALILEEALMAKCERVKHFMVGNPVTASLWQPLSLVRQAMLTNAFSFLPLHVASTWKLISDDAVARFLRKASNSADRQKRLATKVEDACELGLCLKQARLVCSEDTIESVLGHASNGKPYLVVESKDTPRLEGILTLFDLL